MPTPRRTVLLSRLAACVLLVGAAALPAVAQPADLPRQVVTSPKLSDEDVRQIKAFIDRYKVQLANEKEPNGVKIARMRLVEPLTDAQTSLDFRQKYGEALVPELEAMLTKSELVASNAILVLGELATNRAVERVVAVLDDKRSTVRFSAAYAVQRTFSNLMPPRTPGMTSEQVKSVIDSVVKRLAVEDDANVAQALVMALEAASEIPGAQLKDVRSYAVANAAKTVATRIKAMDGKLELDPRWRLAIWRANRLTRAALTTQINAEPRLTDDALKWIGGLAGHTMALTLRRMQAGVNAADERDLLAQTAALAESSYYFAYSAKGGTPGDARLTDLVKGGDAKKYEAAVMEIIGPKKPLTSPAFGFPEDEFVTKR